MLSQHFLPSVGKPTPPLKEGEELFPNRQPKLSHFPRGSVRRTKGLKIEQRDPLTLAPSGVDRWFVQDDKFAQKMKHGSTAMLLPKLYPRFTQTSSHNGPKTNDLAHGFCAVPVVLELPFYVTMRTNVQPYD